MHTIRLRGGWVVTEPAPGTFRRERRFGRPRTLAPNETVWLTVSGPSAPGSVAVNGRAVGAIGGPFAAEIRFLLLERNVLTLEWTTSADSADPDVALEIRDEPMTLSRATEDDYCFTHDLTRSNMEPYVARYWGGWDEAVYRKNYDRTENRVLRLGTDRVGFVRTEPVGDVLVVEDVQILPAYQNRGLGGWLLGVLRQEAGAHGYRAVRLRCFKDNPARRLYLRAGFRIVGNDGPAEWLEWPADSTPSEVDPVEVKT